MNWLRRIRNSAMFIEVILVLAAVIAIIGLATFVHLHGGKTPENPKQTAMIVTNTKHIEPIPNDEPTNAPDTEDARVKGASTSELSTASNSNDAKILKANTCDDNKKSSLESTLNQNIDAENKSYQSRLNNLSSPLGVITDTLNAIVANHKAILDKLESNYKASLGTINCLD